MTPVWGHQILAGATYACTVQDKSGATWVELNVQLLQVTVRGRYVRVSLKEGMKKGDGFSVKQKSHIYISHDTIGS